MHKLEQLDLGFVLAEQSLKEKRKQLVALMKEDGKRSIVGLGKYKIKPNGSLSALTVCDTKT